MAGAVHDLPATMTMESKYRRLPGRSGFFVRNSLWMGADHLLSVRRNPFSESYRRYYFADIQAVVTTEFPNPWTSYGYFAAVLLLVATVALAYARHPLWGSLCCVAALAVFGSWLGAADCACYLKTSVSLEKIASLRLIKSARKTLAILKAEIERTQGSVAPDVLTAGLPASQMVTAAPAALRHCNGRVHWIAFALMVVRGVIASVSLALASSSVPLSLAAGVVGAAILILLILAAIQQRHSDLASSVRRLVYLIFAFYVASGVVSFAVSIYVALQLMPGHANPAMVMNNPAIKLYEVVDMIVFLTLGCAGLILMWQQHRRTVQVPPPLATGNGG